MLRIGFILIPQFQLISLAVASVFEFTNVLADEPLYEVRVLSEAGGAISSSLGVSIETSAFEPGTIDTLIVGAGIGAPQPTPGLLELLRSAEGSARRIAAICNGTFILAEAGLLDGRRATTHWRNARALQARFPNIKVEEDRIFIIDGAIWTSAGATAGIDLALAMVEKDFGSDMAYRVAKTLVVYHRRAGGQSQYSALLEMTPKSDRVQNALVYAKIHLASAISVEQLANAAHLSPRQFSRMFLAETGRSPAKAVEQLRVEAARLMMEKGRHSLSEVARVNGFAGLERMRRAFLRSFGQPPQTMRRSARLDDPSISPIKVLDTMSENQLHLA